VAKERRKKKTPM